MIELTDPEQEPFGMIAATGFGLPAWAAGFFADLPGREGWRCYVARVDGEAQACAAMLIDGGIAEFGIARHPRAGPRPRLPAGPAAPPHPRRRRRPAATRSSSRPASASPDRPSASYRNILRAGFEEAYLRPNWRSAPG